VSMITATKICVNVYDVISWNDIFVAFRRHGMARALPVVVVSLHIKYSKALHESRKLGQILDYIGGPVCSSTIRWILSNTQLVFLSTRSHSGHKVRILSYIWVHYYESIKQLEKQSFRLYSVTACNAEFQAIFRDLV
jgi:hypothetical protein